MAGRFAFNTAIAAVMELVNEVYRAPRAACSPATLRFALATAASLIFPFAPHTRRDVYELLTGERVWEQPWPAADPALLERDTFELVCRSTARCATASQAPAGAVARGAGGARARAAQRRRRTSTASEVVKVVVVPGKLVNFVVR